MSNTRHLRLETKSSRTFGFLILRNVIKFARAMSLGIFVVSYSFDICAQENSVGSLVRVVNQSLIFSSAGEQRAAKLRGEIYSGESLKTGDNAWLTINFFDLTRIVLRPNTELIIRQFPPTMDAGNIVFEIIKGGARVTAGTIANQQIERFQLITPQGKLSGSRSEWVVRICDQDNCDTVEASLERCQGYRSLPKSNRQFVAVYKGVVDLNYCPIEQGLEAGTTIAIENGQPSCEYLDEIPCFILLDDQLGRDKYKVFKDKLTTQEIRPERRPSRPNSRAVQPRPRIDRPPRPRRGN